jgi:uncharacterized membrane protein YfcA
VFLGGIVHGVVGYGIGLVALPVMAFVIPERVPQVLLLIAMPTVLWMALRERKQLRVGAMAWVLGGRVLGTAGGVFLVAILSVRLLQLTFGVMTLLTAAALAFSGVTIRLSRRRQITVGVVSGLMATTAGVGGPPVAVLYADRTGSELRAMMAGVLLVGNLMSLTALGLAGRLRMADLALATALVVPLTAGLVLSRLLVTVVDAGYVRTAVLTVSALAAVVLIGQAVIG